MSYVGSFRRSTAWVRKVGTNALAAGFAWTAAVLFILSMWFFILPIYYFFTLFLFGWLLVPFRLVRRSHRKQEHLQRAQLATMQTMLVQQQQAMVHNQAQGAVVQQAPIASAAAALAGPSALAAGWRADPSRRHQHRYFDGTKWTEHVSDSGRQTTDPV